MCLLRTGIVMQINFFVLNGAPQSFGENIVPGTTPSIHADLNSGVLQTLDVWRTGEMAALVAVPDFRCGLEQRMVDRSQPKVDFQGLAESPTQDVTGVAVEHGRELQPARIY